MILRIFLCLSLLFTVQIVISQEYTLNVKISALPENASVYVQVFREGQKFVADSRNCLEQKVSIKNGMGNTRMEGLESGIYAVMVYHDENNNGILDTNILGMPKEGVGTSNNVNGIPSFKKCQFKLDSSLSMEIKLVYL